MELSISWYPATGIKFMFPHFRQMILENFVLVDDRDKIRNRGIFDDDTGEWTLKPLTSISS